MSFGEPHEHHFAASTRPTPAPASWPREGAAHGTVVTADEQTAGRGRQGRTWTAPPGKALLYSAIVRPLDERHLMLPLAVPLAVCEAAEELRPRARVRGQVAERRPGRRHEARRRPDRGPPPGRLGRDRRRPEPLHRPRRVPPDLRDTAVSIFSLADDAGVWGVPTEPPRCCSGGTSPVPATQPKS